ncbi:MAG: twin-arginine translocation signal domain-containing protein [Sedimentisphaerales bacterium]|nr:twin-arginine translocation signal domain-containing protein [Sedimentisphaerales bacterium]
MGQNDVGRRDFLKAIGLGSAAMALSERPLDGQQSNARADGFISIDPKPKFELSPYLYMQFMEPLGVTDSSVDAAWDFGADRWREDVVEITQELAPTLMRWGGCFCSYYRWKEGVGPMSERRPMLNQLWGGVYNNQVGTHEFVDFCRRVGADPLIVVNFESDGRKYWAVSPKGDVRSGDAKEAGEWVDYCNGPSNASRRQHGVKDPYNVRLWQIGNETSYGEGMDVETAAKKTVEFAKTMRQADPTIQIIGWGDSGWAARMAEIAGPELQYIAFHNGFGPGGEASPLHGIEYRKDPDKTWEYLLRACKAQQAKLDDVRRQVAKYNIPLAMTECHFTLPGRNRCEVLSTWAAGVANACTLNVHERNGDLLKIATLADFCGTRWQNNAVMIPVPAGKSYMMPVAMVMSLYRRHSGQEAVEVTGTPDGLDVAASRTGDRCYLHVVNTRRTQSVKSAFQVRGRRITAGRVHWFSLDPEFEVFEYRPEHTFPAEGRLDLNSAWAFPAASVSAVELTLEPT